MVHFPERRLDGKPIIKNSITQKDITKGGKVVLEMGPGKNDAQLAEF